MFSQRIEGCIITANYNALWKTKGSVIEVFAFLNVYIKVIGIYILQYFSVCKQCTGCGEPCKTTTIVPSYPFYTAYNVNLTLTPLSIG